MKRWSVAFGIALVWAVLIVLTRSTSTLLLTDSDTKVMLHRIEARHDALSWFKGDWPLENHFYRPVVTETFEFDHRIHGWDSPGYGLTNALLCAACILALFWLLRELVGDPLFATVGASLFALWHLLGYPWGPFEWGCYVLAGAAGISFVAALLFKEKARWPAIFALAGSAILVREISGLVQFRSGMIEWVPGRTASTMALFCLLAMAAYVRYERVSAPRCEPEPGPLDPPATRGTELVSVERWPWAWVALSLVCVFLSLASYEQAVMLPALLFGCALAMRLRFYRVRWLWHGCFWAVLGVYVVLRHQVIPPGTSSYQAQQLRSSASVLFDLAQYVFPAAPDAVRVANGAELGIGTLLISQSMDLLMILANLVYVAGLISWMRARFKQRDRAIAVGILFGFAASLVAFLPMAWLKPFSYNHYHYWPLALRAVYVVGMTYVIGDWIATAWSRRARQAPIRLSPAPGSLPHP